MQWRGALGAGGALRERESGLGGASEIVGRRTLEIGDRDSRGAGEAAGGADRDRVERRAASRSRTDGEDDESAARLIGGDPRARVGEDAAVDRLRAVNVAWRAATEQGHEIGVGAQRRGARGERCSLLEMPKHERDVLKVSAAVAGRAEPHALELRGDVCGDLLMLLAARAPSLHRVVGDEVEAGHEIGGRDRARRGLGRVLERERRLGGERTGTGENDEKCETRAVH